MTAMHSGTARDPRRIHILGAGNLGQYLARGLVKQNPKLPVTLLFHRDGLLRDWNTAGEAIECETGGRIDRTGGIDVELVDGSTETSPISNLIVACKTYMTVPALQKVKARLNEESTIVFLQNGMGMLQNIKPQPPPPSWGPPNSTIQAPLKKSQEISSRFMVPAPRTGLESAS